MAFFYRLPRRICRFHDVFGLKFDRDYAAPTAGMCPFSLAGVSGKS